MAIFDEKDKKHLQTMNREFGEMCSRVGRLEGKIEEGFGNISANMKWIERRFTELPCNKHTEMMTKLEKKMSNIEGRTWVWDKNKRAFGVFILGLITALIGAYFTHVMNIFG